MPVLGLLTIVREEEERRRQGATNGLQARSVIGKIYSILLTKMWCRAVALAEVTTARMITARDLGFIAAASYRASNCSHEPAVASAPYLPGGGRAISATAGMIPLADFPHP